MRSGQKLIALSVALALALSFFAASGSTARSSPVVARPRAMVAPGDFAMPIPQQGRVRAPELTGHRGWLNTERPLSLAALRGKIVLLDFWTYGCINCIHIIPDLKRLEERYANQLVVIGVHSAKFENERETENIRRIIMRYEIEHPVVNDADFHIWRSYNVSAWPTQVLIDPAGYIIGSVRGEGNYDVIDRAIAETITEFRQRGGLNEQPLRLALERARSVPLPLAFPSKVLADAAGDRLFIADSNHNRIVITRLDGRLLEIIGAGAAGANDGAYEQATFNRPQGLALDGEALYVADTSNHLIRRVDLRARSVSTIAGTGAQARAYGPADDPARATALSSPWDLLRHERALYIAMAGPHQIWRLGLDSGRIVVFAGSGREERRDGALHEAGFAQPSGLTTDGRTLYVADSESNIIRAIDLEGGANARVRTLAGGDLFDFGDRDGRGDAVRLQHPLGVAYAAGALFIADTYNHKIKRLDLRNGEVRTFAGAGRAGQRDGAQAAFYEPGGLSIAGDRLYVADTNNHAVRMVDLRTRTAGTLMIRGLRPPDERMAATDASDAGGPRAETITLPAQQLRAGSDAALVVNVALPAGYHLNPYAPQAYRLRVVRGAEHLALAESEATRVARDLRLPLRLPLRPLAPGAAELELRLTLYYCREDNTGTCFIKTLVWRAPVEVTATANAPGEIVAQGRVEAQ